MTQLDEVVRGSLSDFAAEALDGAWSGRREREAVSLYVFGHLLRYVRHNGVLYSPAQIGIEVAVPQVAEPSSLAISGRSFRKGQVCKDIVIWSKPAQTCWDDDGKPTVAPAAILEWKFGLARIHGRDLAWLQAFTDAYPQTTGYAVTANQFKRYPKVLCTRVSRGDARGEWFMIE